LFSFSFSQNMSKIGVCVEYALLYSLIWLPLACKSIVFAVKRCRCSSCHFFILVYFAHLQFFKGNCSFEVNLLFSVSPATLVVVVFHSSKLSSVFYGTIRQWEVVIWEIILHKCMATSRNCIGEWKGSNFIRPNYIFYTSCGCFLFMKKV